VISVCLATYNGSAFIKEQLDSILIQIGVDDEVIISDDSSNDDTLDIIKNYKDHRIVIIESAPSASRLGVIKNFERALKSASGDYIFLCDQDDIWLKSKVDESIKCLDENLLVVSDCQVVDASLKEITPSFFAHRGSQSGILNNIIKNSYLGCCMAFKKELLNYALPIPQGAAMHDIWLGLVAETRGKVYFLNKALILFRRHGQNASYTSGKSQYGLLLMIKNRVMVTSLLLTRLIKNLLI